MARFAESLQMFPSDEPRTNVSLKDNTEKKEGKPKKKEEKCSLILLWTLIEDLLGLVGTPPQLNFWKSFVISIYHDDWCLEFPFLFI